MKKIAKFRFCDRCGKRIVPYKGFLRNIHSIDLCEKCDIYFYHKIKDECVTDGNTETEMSDKEFSEIKEMIK